MSEFKTSLEAEIEALKEAESAERKIASFPSQTTQVEVRAIEGYYEREEASKQVLRDGYQALMSEILRKRPITKSAMLRHPGAMPMPSQELVNALYTLSVDDLSPQARGVLLALSLPKVAPVKVPAWKRAIYRAAYAVLKHPVRFAIAFLYALRHGSDEHHT